MENTEEKSKKIGKIQKKSKSNIEKMGKIWKKIVKRYGQHRLIPIEQ